MNTFIRDVRHALRQLRRAPAFTVTALVTLAVGIGANTAIFTLVHGVLLSSLPVANPAQLYKFGDVYNCCVEGGLLGNWSMFSYPFYLDARDHTPAFDALAAAQAGRSDLGVRVAGGPAEPFLGEFVSGNYFSTLGVRTFAGRLLGPADDRPGAAPVAVASYRAWQKYGLDPSLIGHGLTINGMAVTLVGVTPPAFFGDRLDSDTPDFWIPLALEPTFQGRNALLHSRSEAWLYLIGRLRPGARPAQVQAQLTTELRRYLLTPGNASAHYDLKKIGAQVIRLVPGGGGINAMKDDYEQGLLLLMAVAAAVLFIACANLANLLLARGTTHRVRTAIELAMGASRGRVIRRHLTESVVLALVGGLAGLIVALYASKAILLIAFRGPTDVPIAVGPSWPILLFTFGVSLLTGILFGAGPAWMASRSDPADALRGSGRVRGDASAVPQRTLLVLQVAVSLALLTVAALLTQSLQHLQHRSFGFEERGRLIVRINPRSAGYTSVQLPDLYRTLEDRLKRTPGVISESLSLYTAQQGNNWGEGVYVEGKSGEAGSSWDRVSARYFETIGTPIVQGRGFTDQDTATSQRVAVVNEAFARRFFPNEDPIGRHFGKDELSHAGDYEIVGVAADAVYHDTARAVRPMFFVPLMQTVTYAAQVDNRVEDGSLYMGSIELHVRGSADAMAPTIRHVLAQVDPNLTPISMFSFSDLVAIRTSAQTLITRLSSGFGLIALLLAVVGLYGVTSYRVARRTGEIGLRMALGADRRDIRVLVLRGALVHVGLGLLIGAPLAFVAARAVQHQLYGVSPFDPLMLALAAVVLSLCALVASLLPARRAAAVEPVVALRYE